MVKFLRRTWKRYSKLGRKRKKKQSWRSPKGRDNKIREKRKGYPAHVNIGYSSDKKVAGKIKGKKVTRINNIRDLDMIQKGEIAVLGRVGKKKKIEIVKKAKENKIEISNLNVKKFLRKNTEKEKVEKLESKKEKPKEKK